MEFQISGFPRVAAMAKDRIWYPIKNLVRRQALPAVEFSQQFEGKTALEWAQTHGKQEMADELRYYVSKHFVY